MSKLNKETGSKIKVIGLADVLSQQEKDINRLAMVVCGLLQIETESGQRVWKRLDKGDSRGGIYRYMSYGGFSCINVGPRRLSISYISPDDSRSDKLEDELILLNWRNRLTIATLLKAIRTQENKRKRLLKRSVK